MNTAVDLLRAARTVISDPNVWVKSGDQYARGKRCAIQAIAGVIEETPRAYGGFAEVDAYRYLRLAVPDGSVTAYNDHPDTTHEDIIAVYDSAIERASS